MDRFVLRRPVNIHGRNFWGRRVTVRLEPVSMRGWFWKVRNHDVPIEPKTLLLKKNRVVLGYRGNELNVFEHLGAMRFTGLDSIRIVTEDEWLPHDGCALQYFNAITPHIVQEGSLALYTTERPVSVFEESQTLTRSIYYTSEQGNALTVVAGINYPKLGNYAETWTFPNIKFAEIAKARTQGYPPSRYPLGKIASCFGWPHFNTISWPQDQDAGSANREFVRHRILDILGTFSALCPPGGILVGKISSHCAGHAHDISLIQKASLTACSSVYA